MANVYDVLANSADSEQQSIHWVAMGIRFRYRKTFNTSKMLKSRAANKKSLSTAKSVQKSTSPGFFVAPVKIEGSQYDVSDQDIEDIMEESEPIFLENDLISWAVNQGKDSFMGSCQLQLIHSNLDYTKELVPGDWLMFWVMNSKSEYDSLKKRINDGQVTNYFDDGFKFVGRVQNVRRRVQRLANGGIHIGYTITAASFSEFNNQIFFDPMLMNHYTQAQNGDVKFWLDLGQQIDKLLLLRKDKQKTLSSQLILPKLLAILLGKGPSSDTTKVMSTAFDGTGLQNSPNGAYLIPGTVSKLLTGGKSKSYSELLKFYIGVQSYPGKNHVSEKYNLFFPDLNENQEVPGTWECNNPLGAEFLARPTPWTGQSVWSIMSSYVNNPVDEMFCTLRVCPDGRVWPSLIARQTTYNTAELAKGYDKGLITPFLDVPRWKIARSLIFSLDHGTSDAYRFNYIHFLGRTNLDIQKEKYAAYSRNPPLANLHDIQRSGLKLKVGQVGASLLERTATNAKSPGGFWQTIIADALMDGHLKHSGSMTCSGIFAPICVGDNTEVDNLIFQIERVNHSGSIQADGKKQFITTIDLSNGISSTNDGAESQIYHATDITEQAESTNHE